MKSYKVLIDSAHFRCTLNLVSSSMIYRYLVENDHKITNVIEKADFVIINSCGYHQQKRDESVALYKKYNESKKQGSKIIMYGCIVKIDEELLKTFDLIPIGFNDGNILDEFFFKKKKFAEMTPKCDIETRNKICNKINYLDYSKHANFFLSRLFMPFSKKIKTKYEHFLLGLDHYDKMLVEVCKGCLGNCYYCAIKKAKGDLKSRSIDLIISDIKSIYDPTKTLFLVADDCSYYGLDIGTNIFKLLDKINKEYPDLKVQINYISPNLLIKYHDQYLDLFRKSNLTYVTIPMQSGSNRVIKNMNRHYDSAEVVKIIKELKKISPDTLIEGHFIIGYPGETFFDFLRTLFITRYFDYPLSFPYSDTKGTKSYELSNKKGEFTKSLRMAIILIFLNLIVFYRLLTK